MRRAARIDANQPDMVACLRKLGCSVHITAGLGNGYPDLSVGLLGTTVLAEVKDPAKPPSARKLTEDEFKFFRDWKGWVVKLETEADCIELVRKIKQEFTYRTKGFAAGSMVESLATNEATSSLMQPRKPD